MSDADAQRSRELLGTEFRDSTSPSVFSAQDQVLSPRVHVVHSQLLEEGDAGLAGTLL